MPWSQHLRDLRLFQPDSLGGSESRENSSFLPTFSGTDRAFSNCANMLELYWSFGKSFQQSQEAWMKNTAKGAISHKKWRTFTWFCEFTRAIMKWKVSDLQGGAWPCGFGRYHGTHPISFKAVFRPHSNLWWVKYSITIHCAPPSFDIKYLINNLSSVKYSLSKGAYLQLANE